MKIYEISFMYDGVYYVHCVATKKEIQSEEDAFDALAVRYPSFNREKEHRLIGHQLLCCTEDQINSNWCEYDQTVAKTHLANYGMIFVDPKSNDPFDDEYNVEDFYAAVVELQKKERSIA